MLKRRLWGAITVLMLLAILDAPAGAGGPESAALGSIIPSGPVWVGNDLVPLRATVFEGDFVTTGKTSSAILNLRSQAAVEIGADSALALSRGKAPVDVALKKGVAFIRSAGARPLRVGVLGAAVELNPESGRPGICRIVAAERSAAVFAYNGKVAIKGPRGHFNLEPGNMVEFVAGGSPQAPPQAVGTVAKLIPEVLVQHAAGEGDVPLVSGELVNREDAIRTERYGRVRIELFGGSSLNVGPLSKLSVTTHDPDKHQTRVAFTEGHLSGEAVTPSGGSFQVVTNAALVAAGGRFALEAAGNKTIVCQIKGASAVRSANSATAGEVALHTGECTSVTSGAAPEAVAQNLGRINRELTLTSLEEAPGPEEAETQLALGGAAAGVAGAAAIVSGIDIIYLGRATDKLNTAQGQFSTATTQLNSAASAAGAAGSNANSVCTAIQNLQASVSPSAPPPSCP